MSIYNALYGRDGHGVGPNEPEKKGFARFCQMVGRDLGQLLGTNLMVCVLCLPAALGVSLGVTLLSLPLTVVCSAVTGLLTGPAMVLLADCALRSLQNDPSQWLPRAKQTLAAHWKTACGFGCIGTLVLGLLCFVSAFVFEAAAQQGYYPGLAILVFTGFHLPEICHSPRSNDLDVWSKCCDTKLETNLVISFTSSTVADCYSTFFSCNFN